jgi:hypothetical protein
MIVRNNETTIITTTKPATTTLHPIAKKDLVIETHLLAEEGDVNVIVIAAVVIKNKRAAKRVPL